jgi:hypothetical protein
MAIEAAQISHAIERARINAALYAKAANYYAAIAPGLLGAKNDREPQRLRASDAGRCSRELWADLNGKFDLLDTTKGLLRMDNGSLMGPWLACLLKAGLELEFFVELEPNVMHAGVSGHVDAIIDTVQVEGELQGRYETIATVEFKWSAWTGDWRGDCKKFQRDQSGLYALATLAPQHFVVIYYAASPERLPVKGEGWIDGSYLVVHPFSTAATEREVNLEYERLAKALAAEMPEPDPPDAFRCKSCRFSLCERNPHHDVEATLEESLL